MSQRSIPQRCLCVVTDRRLCAERGLVETVRLAVQGGASMVQLREKDLPKGELRALARQLRHVVESPTLLIVNGDVDAAKGCGADGVHLPADGMSIAKARRKSGDLLIGRSVHSVDAALRAADEGADYLMVGTMYETASKPGKRAEGPELLRAIDRWVDMPLLGIGGIDASNAAMVIEAGAGGVAVISVVMGAPDPAGAAKAIRETMPVLAGVSQAAATNMTR